LKLQAASHKSAEIAMAKNGAKRFGDRVLFKNINFVIRGGEHVAIVGKNGCGKTTLLRILLGIDNDYSGTIKLGAWVKTGLLDQNAEYLDESRTMLEEVYAFKEQDEPAMRKHLAKVGFYGEEVNKRIAVLSGGERVRLKLALLLLREPQCLILDEPTNHLDLPAREAVERAVAEFKGTVIAVSHDRYFLNRCAARILAFENETIRAYQGNWDSYKQAETRERK
jgi:ATP-binding cassette subfamily F protein 3